MFIQRVTIAIIFSFCYFALCDETKEEKEIRLLPAECWEPIFEITNNTTGQTFNPSDFYNKQNFYVGDHLDLTVFFRKYQAVHIRTIIPNCEGPFYIYLPFKRLIGLHFVTFEKERIVNGIKYFHQIECDDEEVPEYRVNQTFSKKAISWEILVKPNYKKIRIYIGYEYQEFSKKFLFVRTDKFKYVDVNKLITHLKKINQKQIKKCLNDIVDSKNLKSKDVDTLIQYLSTLKSKKIEPIQARLTKKFKKTRDN